MGKASKALKAFIVGIPDGKLSGFTSGEHTLYSDADFRLDNQGLTTGDPQYYNLHVQINNQTTISTLQREKGATIANTLVPTDGSWTPEQIRVALLANMKI
ncbi:hypothetical protein N7468_006358 [Penicillium chermesinum]|uniref:Uncharacterized protein n=1 Tax=Penicillium chermesinum TaxID=63820 RepID=A0A9W9NSJ9_9EURO|nr:uncharacterized protein N7468_006358 [Penicillium chermesinum]KAJ5225133.1 hypothetical protein N7468_006358 [Penicillium chermesinum]KAJ6151858.1 hypothetical protein N7470_006986 [Penicillium chermesinum]